MASVRMFCLRSGILFLTTVLCARCATTISAIHTPLYPGHIESSKIVATAENRGSGIKQIVLFITQGDMINQYLRQFGFLTIFAKNAIFKI